MSFLIFVFSNYSPKGRHFSSVVENNVVTFGIGGVHKCDVITANSKRLTCRVDISTQPPMMTWMNVMLTSKHTGNAFIDINEDYKKSFIFQMSLR